MTNFTEKFNELNQRNVNQHVEKKNGLNYLSWAYVQQELTKLDNDFSYRIKEYPDPDSVRDDVFLPYLVTNEGYMVNVEITLFGKTKSEWLPVLDNRNKTVQKGQGNMFDINKAHKRAFVKCAAQFGLGNYLYLGEDEPEYIEKPATPEQIGELKLAMNDFVEKSVKAGNDNASYDLLVNSLKLDFENITDVQVDNAMKKIEAWASRV